MKEMVRKVWKKAVEDSELIGMFDDARCGMLVATITVEHSIHSRFDQSNPITCIYDDLAHGHINKLDDLYVRLFGVADLINMKDFYAVAQNSKVMEGVLRKYANSVDAKDPYIRADIIRDVKNVVVASKTENQFDAYKRSFLLEASRILWIMGDLYYDQYDYIRDIDDEATREALSKIYPKEDIKFLTGPSSKL